MVIPDNAFTAGTDVRAAIKRTKKKLAFALRTAGSNGREMIPASGTDRDKKNNNDSVINIRCAVNLFYFSLFSETSDESDIFLGMFCLKTSILHPDLFKNLEG
jgi:hypothetical protein